MLGGCPNPRIAGHSQVIEACITYHLASRDGRRRPADTLFDAKERVLQPGVCRARKSLLQGNAFRKLGHVGMLRRDRFRRRHWRRRRCRSSRHRLLTRTSTVHGCLNVVDHIAAGHHVVERVLGESYAKRFFQAVQHGQPGDRVEPEVIQGTVQRNISNDLGATMRRTWSKTDWAITVDGSSWVFEPTAIDHILYRRATRCAANVEIQRFFPPRGCGGVKAAGCNSRRYPGRSQPAEVSDGSKKRGGGENQVQKC